MQRTGRSIKRVKDIDCKDTNPWCRFLSKYDCRDESVEKQCSKTCGQCKGTISIV